MLGCMQFKEEVDQRTFKLRDLAAQKREAAAADTTTNLQVQAFVANEVPVGLRLKGKLRLRPPLFTDDVLFFTFANRRVFVRNVR